MFDQLLVSKGLLIQGSPLTAIENTARIEIFPEMVDHRVAHGPIRFGLPKGNAVQNVKYGRLQRPLSCFGRLTGTMIEWSSAPVYGSQLKN